MPTDQTLPRQSKRKQIAWFILLWLMGFFGMALLALPFHLLAMAAKP